jgi:uncharacterized protein
MPSLRSWWQSHVVETRRRVNAESRLHWNEVDPSRPDRRTFAVVLTGLACLFLLRTFGSTYRLGPWSDLLKAVGLPNAAEAFIDWLRHGENAKFNGRVFWSLTRLAVYLAIPVLVVKVFRRARLRDFGWALPRTRDWTLYGVLAALLAPAVILASYQPGFMRKYPFYPVGADEPLWPGFWSWEAMYAGQFMALEFFFRGFLIHGTKHRFGFGAIYFSVVPYMMIHCGKPPAEVLGSVVAGLVLGTLSLGSGSVWGGAALHAVVAVAMDCLVLAHRLGRF